MKHFLNGLLIYLGFAIVLWLGIVACYGAGGTPHEFSPWYNTPVQERTVIYIYIPIACLLWPIWGPFLGFSIPSLRRYLEQLARLSRQ